MKNVFAVLQRSQEPIIVVTSFAFVASNGISCVLLGSHLTVSCR